MKKTQLQETIKLSSRQILRESSEFVGLPTTPSEYDFTEIVDRVEELTEYKEKSNITTKELTTANQTLEKLLSYMAQRSDNVEVSIVKQTICEVIVEAAKIYSHICINEEPIKKV